MANLIELQAQIESLKKQAESIRNKEFRATVAEIREKMAAFGITVKDLQSPAKSAGRRSKDANPVKAKAAKAAKRPKSDMGRLLRQIWGSCRHMDKTAIRWKPHGAATSSQSR